MVFCPSRSRLPILQFWERKVAAMQRWIIGLLVFVLLIAIFDLYVNDAQLTTGLYRQAQAMGRQLDIYAGHLMNFIGNT
jgi:hypothetical protein